MSGNETTIRVDVDTRVRIKQTARKDETYDDFINRLLDMFYESEQ